MTNGKLEYQRRARDVWEGIATATVREGNNAVLVVVDMQVGVMDESWDSGRVVANVARVVERARAQGVPVIWVQHSDDGLPYGSPEWQLVDALAPATGEVVIHKRYNSAFEETELEEELAKAGATHVVLCGAATNWCIRATAYGALDRGFDATLISDAHTTGPVELNGGSRIEAATIIEELNATLPWISYPGRTAAVVASEEVDFAAPGR